MNIYGLKFKTEKVGNKTYNLKYIYQLKRLSDDVLIWDYMTKYNIEYEPELVQRVDNAIWYDLNDINLTVVDKHKYPHYEHYAFEDSHLNKPMQ